MVYKRRFKRRGMFKKRGYYPRKRFFKKGRRRLIVPRCEIKYADDNIGFFNLPQTLNIAIMNNIVLGTTGSLRIGQQIKCVALYVQCDIVLNPLASSDNVRLFVILDHQANGTSAPVNQILQVSNDTMSPLTQGEGKRFRILYDKHFVLCSNGASEKFIRIYKKLWFYTKYNTGNAGTVADINTNALYFGYMSANGVNLSQMAYYARFRWCDA